MKEIRSRAKSLLVIICIGALLIACENDNNTPQATKNIIPSDTVYVAVDSSQRAILASLIAVYEGLNPLKKVIPIYDREKKLFQYLENNQADLLLRSYELNSKEKSILANRRLTPKIAFLWTDGLALIAAKSFSKDSISETDLLNVLTKPSTAFHLIIDNSNTSTYNLLLDKYGINNKQINAYSAGSEDSVIKSTLTHSNSIGIIGSAYFTSKYLDLPQDIKLIGLIPKGHSNAEYPFQDQLYNKAYPLERLFYSINLKGKSSFGSSFVSFMISERGQRIILKAGLLPAKIPPRSIEIVK